MESRSSLAQHAAMAAVSLLPALVLLLTAPPPVSSARPAVVIPAPCACEVTYITGSSAGNCGCDWVFNPDTQKEGDCSPEPGCSPMTFCNVTGSVDFATSPVNPPPSCSGQSSPVNVTAPCRAVGTNEIPCPGGTSVIKITVTCHPCTPG